MHFYEFVCDEFKYKSETHKHFILEKDLHKDTKRGKFEKLADFFLGTKNLTILFALMIFCLCNFAPLVPIICLTSFTVPDYITYIWPLYVPLCILAILLSMLIAFIIRLIIFKLHKSTPININLYNRELPSNLTPAHARVLITNGIVDAKSLAATILDLIDKDYLTITDYKRTNLFIKNIILTRTNKSLDNLFDYEIYLLNWLFKNQETSSHDIKNILQNKLDNPSEKFTTFQGLVLASFPAKKYYKYDDVKTKTFFKMVIPTMIITFIITLLTNLFFENGFYLNPLFIFIHSLPLYIAIYTPFKVKSCTKEGIEIADGYLDLKKYLKDFSIIKERSAKEIAIWDYYLSYSVALGIKSKAFKEINNFFGKEIYNRKIILSEKEKEESDNRIISFDDQVIIAERLYNDRR